MGYRYGFGELAEEFLLFFLLIALVAITVAILFLLNLQRTLEEVSDHNRQIAAGRVWLLLIPLFSVGYAFYLLPKISDSLRSEFEERENPQPGDYGMGLGRAYAIIGAIGLFNRVISLGFLGGVVSLGGLVVMIIYWVKMAQYKNMLQNSQRGTAGFSNRTDLLD